MALEELKRARDEANRKLGDVREARDEERRIRLDAAKAQIDAELRKKHGPAIEILLAEYNAAFIAYQDALDAHATNGADCPVPLGTKVAHWGTIGDIWHKGAPQILEYGIVEAVTTTTEHPSNKASYSRADPGEFIIRILKKDGTPGVKYQRFMRSYGAGKSEKSELPHGWKPADPVLATDAEIRAAVRGKADA